MESQQWRCELQKNLHVYKVNHNLVPNPDTTTEKSRFGLGLNPIPHVLFWMVNKHVGLFSPSIFVGVPDCPISEFSSV